MSNAFVPRRHEEYAQKISRITAAAVGSLAEGDVVDIHSVVDDITLRIATDAFLGEELGGETTVAKAGRQSLRMVLSPAVVALPYDLPGLPYRRFLSSVSCFGEEMWRIVEGREAELATGEDLLSVLVRAARDGELAREEIVGHASVLFAAGHETTSNAIAWALFFLSQSPAWEGRLREELDAVTRGETPSVSDVEKSDLLEMTIQESLRLMPPAPWNSRTTTSDCELGGQFIPARTEVVASIYHSHRDRDVWHRADEFLPERWSDPAVPSRSFRPFGAGQRVCVGASFATLEMKLVLATILQRFGLDLVDGARIDPLVNITMTFGSGLPMRLRPPADRALRGRPKGRVRRLLELPA